MRVDFSNIPFLLWVYVILNVGLLASCTDSDVPFSPTAEPPSPTPQMATPTPSPTAEPPSPAPRMDTPSPIAMPDFSFVQTQDVLAIASIRARISEEDGIYKTGEATGYILNDAGKECSYVQKGTDVDSVSYFYEGFSHSEDTLLVFDDPQCMTPTSPIGMRLHQEEINRVIAPWYSDTDANYQTEPGQLRRKSDFQVRGWCIQSETYPLIGVMIDYFTDEQSIVAVVHSLAASGCNN